MNVSHLDARRRAREEATAAAARAETERRKQEADNVHLGTLAILADTVLVLEAGGVREAIDGLKVLYERIAARPLACTSTVHLGPVHVHPSGRAQCACGQLINR